MIARLIGFSAKNRFLIFLLVLGALVWGAWALKHTPLDALPDLSDTQVIIYTEWMGRSPDLIEDQVTYPITSTLLAAPKVQVVRGFSFLGSSFIYVIFDEGTDIYWARSRILEYLQAVKSKLPADVNPTLGPDATSLGWGFSYALVDETGQRDLAELRSLQDYHLKLAIESVPGVSQVASLGGFVKQYQITVDPVRLSAFNIPIGKVMETVRRSNRDVEGRVIELSGVEYMVRGRGYVAERPGPGGDRRGGRAARGRRSTLKDVARIQLGPDIRRGIADLDGRGEVVGGIVVVRFGENVLSVIERVKERLKRDIEPSLPKGVKVVVTYDRSELIGRAVDTLKEEILKLSIAVSIVCIVFLFHLPSALVVILTLPVAIIISFICMFYLGVTSNIMSLSGIAIAIGAMVDASIIMVENAHKKLEEWEAHGRPGDRTEVIIEAAKEVGPSLFFSLLVITVGFLPVFTLEAQAGRLFKPLAYTKTFAMLFSSFLAVTLTPVLMTLFIRGKIRSEEKNPVSWILHRLYEPVARFALRFRKTVIVLALIILAVTVYPFMKLGTEFMPPLYEGTLFYMPVTVPGASVSEVGRLLNLQDRIIKKMPEVAQVFGKAGRAETATDPAPLEMFETVINLKPESEWRPGMTVEKLKNELNDALSIPGVSNSFTMPIKARIDMLSTGIRTPVGIKVMGPNLDEIEKIGLALEERLKTVPGTRSVYAERVTTGYFLDIAVRRDRMARYGLDRGRCPGAGPDRDRRRERHDDGGGEGALSRERPLSPRTPERSRIAEKDPGAGHDARRAGGVCACVRRDGRHAEHPPGPAGGTRRRPDRQGADDDQERGGAPGRLCLYRLLGQGFRRVTSNEAKARVAGPEDSRGVPAHLERRVRKPRPDAREAQTRHPAHAPDHHHPDLLQHQVGDENGDRPSGRALFPGRLLLAPLSARLQHEHRRLGGDHRAGRSRRGDGRRHAPLSRSGL